MRGLARASDGDVADTDQGDRVRLLLEDPLVEEEVAQIDPRAIQPGEEVKERIVTSLHEGNRSKWGSPTISKVRTRRAGEPVSHYTGSSGGGILGSSSPRRS